MARIDRQRLAAKFQLLPFMQRTWQRSDPLIVGRHTRAITSRIDRAIYDYEHGRSTYLIITVPFRHGKSDIASRYLPPHFLGRHPESEVILATYDKDLSRAMSRDARKTLRTPEYLDLWPKNTLSPESHAASTWALSNGRGKFQACTIKAGATGKGANLLVVDDYLRGREAAESATIRDTQWDNFTGNLMTRLAPVHIVLIVATPWHSDDIIGRIRNRNTVGHRDYDEAFPTFELLKFPARDDNGSYLFTERFGPEWYQMQFAQLGTYQAAGLLQCEPVPRGGNMLRTDGVQIHDSLPSGLRYVRFWDLASTEKERIKDDPDWTVGGKLAVRIENGVPHLYIDDLAMCQQEATVRNTLILDTSERDGAAVPIGVESVAGYKDTYTTIRDILKGKRTVRKINVSSDKVVCAGEVEPIFEAGHVHMRRAWWNDRALTQLAQFPAGSHDDIADVIAKGYIMAYKLTVRPARTIQA